MRNESDPYFGKGTYRVEMGGSIGEAFIQYSGGVLLIHAPNVNITANAVKIEASSVSVTANTLAVDAPSTSVNASTLTVKSGTVNVNAANTTVTGNFTTTGGVTRLN